MKIKQIPDIGNVISIGEVVITIASAKPGYLLCNGLTIGSPGSNATARSNNDVKVLWDILWEVPSLPMLTSSGLASDRGIKTVDWAANRQIALPNISVLSPLKCFIKFSDKVSESFPGINPEYEAFYNSHTAANSLLTVPETEAVINLINDLKAAVLFFEVEWYVFLGSNYQGRLIRLNPPTAAPSVNNLNLSNFVDGGLIISGNVSFPTPTQSWIGSLSGVGNDNAFSFGVYVNRAAGSGLEGRYASVGQVDWTNGVAIWTGISSNNHGFYSGESFSNQFLSSTEVGLFSGSYMSASTTSFRRRDPYKNGIKGQSGGLSNWINPTNYGIRFSGNGNTRIAGGFYASRAFTDAEQLAAYNALHTFNVSIGRGF